MDFVFFRDGEWQAEVIDDKLYLKYADFNTKGAPGHRELNTQLLIAQEEKYRKMYQVPVEPSRIYTALTLAA
jgi:hypothetical protein